MKKTIKYILAASFSVMMLASCSTYNLDDLVSEPWHKIVCLRDTEKSVAMTRYFTPEDPTIGETAIGGVGVLKSGSKPELAASVKLTLMSAEEIAAKGITGKLLPAEWYDFDEDVEIPSGETGALVKVKFYPTGEIQNYLRLPENQGIDHIIPLKLTSENDKINESRSVIVLKVKLP